MGAAHHRGAPPRTLPCLRRCRRLPRASPQCSCSELRRGVELLHSGWSSSWRPTLFLTFSPPPRRTTTSAKLRRTRSGGSGELSGEHGPRRRWIRGWRRCWPLPPSPSSRRPWHEAVVTDPSPTSHGCEPEGGCGGGSSSYGRVREREQLQRWLVRTRSRGLFAPASAVCPAPARQALPADPA
jgi:hypothetical protein